MEQRNALLNIIYYLLERRGDSHKYMLYKSTLITGDRFQTVIYPSPTYIKQTYKLCCSTEKTKKTKTKPRYNDKCIYRYFRWKQNKHFRNCIIKIKHKHLTLQKSIFFSCCFFFSEWTIRQLKVLCVMHWLHSGLALPIVMLSIEKFVFNA